MFSRFLFVLDNSFALAVCFLKHYTLKRKPAAASPTDVEQLAAEPSIPVNDDSDEKEIPPSPARTVKDDEELASDSKVLSG